MTKPLPQSAPFRPTARPLRVRGTLLLGVFLVTLGASTALALTPGPCRRLERKKWEGRPTVSREQALLYLELPARLPETPSVEACRACGLWAWTSPPFRLPREAEERLLFLRARCLEVMGMPGQALEAYRAILRRPPPRGLFMKALEASVRILSEQGNRRAVQEIFEGLTPKRRAALSPEGRYLFAQALFSLGRDGEAEALLSGIAASSDFAAYALYLRAQIAFRRGKSEQALDLLGTILRAEPSAIHAPPILQELAWLTRARILYQQHHYERAVHEFRNVGPSKYFLPEALMGIGWCYKALEKPSKAIAFFRAVERTYADADTLAEARLETARLLAEAGDHRASKRVFQEILNDLHGRISRYKKYGRNPEWIAWLTAGILEAPEHLGDVREAAPLMAERSDVPGEMEALLRKARYTSPRMKSLLRIRRDLKRLDLLLEETTSSPVVPALHASSNALTAPYPPLDVSAPILEGGLPSLLDLHFALLDAEYRMTETADRLGLAGPGERSSAVRGTARFFRRAFTRLLLPPGGSADPERVLTRLQSTVRNLPLPLEEKERVLAKILYMKRILFETDKAVDRWTEGMQIASAGAAPVSRLLLLRKWMNLTRILLDLRTWRYRSPTLFLLDIPSVVEPAGTSPGRIEEARERIAARVEESWRRLEVLLEREVERIHAERLAVLEDLLVRTQLDYADALIQQQGRLLEDLRSSSPENQGEERQ